MVGHKTLAWYLLRSDVSLSSGFWLQRKKILAGSAGSILNTSSFPGVDTWETKKVRFGNVDTWETKKYWEYGNGRRWRSTALGYRSELAIACL